MQALVKNLRVRSKLLLGFGLVAMVSLLVGVVGIFSIIRLQDMDSELYKYQTLPLLELRIINGCFEQNRAFMRDMILENDPEKLMVYIHEMEKNSNKIQYSLQTFAQSLFTEAEKKEFAYFSNVLENFEYHRDQVVELCKNGDKEYAQTVLMSDGPKLSANFSKAIDRLSQIKEATGRQTAETNKSRAQTAIVVTGLLLLLAGIVATEFGIIIARIISAPLMAETKQLGTSLTVLQRVLNNMDACLYVSDPHTDELLFINDKMRQEFALTGDIVGRRCWQVFHNDGKQRCEFCPNPKLLANPATAIVWEKLNDVTEKYYKNTDCIIEWLDGKKVHLQHSVDITDLKLAEISQKNTMLAAESASQAKSEFLSRMSHEMRTPMNAIIGMTNIAQMSDDVSKKEYCLEKIANASKHLLGVINDILDMSKIEANKFELCLHEFELEKMLMNITNVVNFRAEEKKQNLIITVDKQVPLSIISDETRLSQVITNLLSNAIKFTPNNGTIILHAAKLEETNDISTLKIEVTDNGIGISEEQQSRLFTSFEQADGSISRKYGGTGLGLVISKKIVSLMGGSIWIESQLNQGAKFIFTIKVKNGKNQMRPALSNHINTSNVRILIVDDSPEVRDYFVNVMSAFGLPCDVAADGFEALAMINDCKGTPYNIIFVDWIMPELNGIDLSKKIKEIANQNAVIIMISVAEWGDIENEARAAGVSKFIPKPLFPSTIMNVLNEILGVSIKDELSPKNITKHDFKNFTLLLAEDVDINREIICSLLEETGIRIDIAENGRKALTMFAANPDAYHLLLMDIHMPEMDGYEATQKIRSLGHAKAKNIPIIAMTANVFREDIEKCKATGMNDHIGKPIDTNELFFKLNKYLNPSVQKSNQAKPYRPVAFTNSLSSETVSDYTAFLPAIDAKAGLGRVMNNKKLYFTLLKNFTGRELASELIKAMQANDFDQAAYMAHALKGVTANLGFIDLNAIVSVIEAQAKGRTACVELIPDLDEIIDTTMSSIHKLLESEGIR